MPVRRLRWSMAALALALVPLTGSAEPDFAVPTMGVDRIVATGDDGRALGTLVLPSIVAGDRTRPLLVVFNGGPGAASAWLQLGLLGPWQFGGDGRLVPNRDGVWDRADILFVDPLGTGFSRTIAQAADVVQSRDGDGRYLSRAIVAWMDRHGRHDAPVLLLGESYGAERAVAVAAAWARAHVPVRLAGIALLSQTVLGAQALDRAKPATTLPANLPTMAATACWWTHRADPLACAQQAQAPGATDLTGLGGADFARLATRPGGMTLGQFRHLYRAPGHLVLGIYDSRQGAAMRAGSIDPALAALLPRVGDAARLGSRMTLGFDRSPVDGSPYVLYDPQIRAAWRYGADPVDDRRPVDDLARVLRASGARLLVAGGVFDTVSSYAADRMLVARLGLPAGQVTRQSYPGGHMFYFDPACRSAFLAELRRLIETVRPAGTAIS